MKNRAETLDKAQIVRRAVGALCVMIPATILLQLLTTYLVRVCVLPHPYDLAHHVLRAFAALWGGFYAIYGWSEDGPELPYACYWLLGPVATSCLAMAVSGVGAAAVGFIIGTHLTFKCEVRERVRWGRPF